MSQYVDEPYLSGILSGVLLGLALLWLLIAVNHLWQVRLRRHAEGLPFELRPVGVRARLFGAGEIHGRAVELMLLAGPRGERAKVELEGQTHKLDLAEEALLPQLERLADRGRPARE